MHASRRKIWSDRFLDSRALSSFLSSRPNFFIAVELVVLILKGPLSTKLIPFPGRGSCDWPGSTGKSHGRSFDVEATNLQPVLMSTLWRGRPLTNLLYWHLSCFWRLTLNSEHCSIPLMEIPIGYLIFSSCFHCFVLVFIVCPYFICLSLAVVSDWHQELIFLASLDVAGCTKFRTDQSSCLWW